MDFVRTGPSNGVSPSILRSLSGMVGACPACGKTMTPTAGVSLTGQYFCSRHDGEPPCIACMAPADPRGRTEVRLCRQCAVTTVSTQQDVKRLLPAIAAQLGELSIRTITPVRVRLVSRSEMQSAGPSEALGLTISRATDVVDLMVMRDLPVIKFGSTVAHEVMHAYLTQQRFPPLPEPVAEGLCQLLAYAWVRRQSGPAAQAETHLIKETPNPVYGDGFRRARASVERVGVRKTLEHVRQRRDFP
jgi:hypothetical protein